MKIVHYRFGDEEDYGKLDEQGTIHRLAGDIFGDFDITDRKLDKNQVQLLPPVLPPNIIAIGLNYKQHARESGHENFPERPVIFLKATTSVIGPGDSISLPEMAPGEVDYEAELAVIIGKLAKNVEVDEALDYVLGYTCANDVSARDCQRRLDEQWARGKSFDTFCPLGPVIETVLDPDNCKIRSRLNGRVMQNSNTSDMIFSPAELVSYCSKNMTLLPGTVILTGTPEGVGFAREPQVFLHEGDDIEIEIENIGTLSNHVTTSESFDGKGSRVARVWSKYLGTSQLTPSVFSKMKSFIEDGIEEDLIIEVMKLSKNAEGNPANYIIRILNDLIERDIYTVSDFKEKEGEEEHGKKVSGTSKEEKTRTPEEELEELYRDGYR